MLRQIPLRWVITFCSLLISLLIVVGLGGGLYLQVSTYVWHAVARRAHTQVAEALKLVDNEQHAPPRIPMPAPAGWQQNAPDVASEVGSHFTVCRIMLPDGTLLAQAGGPRRHAGPPPTDFSRIAQALGDLHSEPHHDSRLVYEVGGVRDAWLVVLIPLQQQGQVVGIIEVDTSLRNTHELLDALSQYVGVGAVLSVLLSVAVSLWLAGLVTRPLERLADTTRRLAAGDFTARTGLGGGANEVYAVGNDFDEMAIQVQAAFLAQRRFVADASHELKTPLTAIGGMAEMLRLPTISAEHREKAVDTIEREVARMSGLVKDLLMLSVAEGRRERPRERVAVRELMDESATYAKLVGQHHEVTVVPPPSLFVIGDGEQLSRVLHNLIDNAIKYTPEGGRIKVAAARHGSQVCLSVEDTGTGVSKEDLTHVFERFYRADRSRDRKTGGSGLGLSIVKALVEAHDGTVGMTSELGRGTRVEVRLPAADL
ncbi:MAG: sensor histidine kinase [Candidatus Xenobia bacterium]